MVGKSNNVLVEYDYQNIILIDPNKLVDEQGRAEERLVDHEDLVMYANLTCKLIPRTKLAIGADIQDSIREVTLAEINFLRQSTNKPYLDNAYTDEITGKNTLDGKGENQPSNTQISRLVNGKTITSIDQKTLSDGKNTSVNNGLFGITNISIKNNTSFVPTVTIEFEDVRGRALFERGDQSPYAAFFHMPYPIFYLTIKGYYGKAVKYPLQLHTFNARFDSNSGNYHVTAVFYSYKYGVLNDLPMGSLFAVPTMYQSEYTSPAATASNNTVSTTTRVSKGYQKIREVYSDYKAKNLIPMNFPEYTIQELISKLETIEDLLKASLGKQDLSALTDADNYENLLKNYKLDIYSSGNNSWYDKFIDSGNYIIDKNDIKVYFLKKEQNVKQFEIDANKSLEQIVGDYNKKLSSNKTFGNKEDGSPGTFSIDNEKIVTKVNNPITFQTFIYPTIDFENNIEYEKTYIARNGKKPTLIELKAFENEIKNQYRDGAAGLTGSNKPAYFFEGSGSTTSQYLISKGFTNCLSLMLQDEQKKKQKIEEEITKKLSNILEQQGNGLGFRPTIRNVCAIIFASAEAFMRLMDDVHTTAWERRNELVRRQAILSNPSSANSPDAKTYVSKLSNEKSEDYPVYPWPQYFIEKQDDKGNSKFEITYPGNKDIVGKTKGDDAFYWPEVEFVEEFISSFIQRSFLPLKYQEDNSNLASKLSINSIEFPVINKPFLSKQISKFIYEMWERFMMNVYYQRLHKNNQLSSFVAEQENVNIEKSEINNDPYLVQSLRARNFSPQIINEILLSVSNDGTGESYQQYERGIFVTPYIKTAVDNSFTILGPEYYNQSITETQSSISAQPLSNLDTYLKNTESNKYDFCDVYPYVIKDWCDKNLANTGQTEYYSTSNVLIYNNSKKLISNFDNLSTNFTKRPFTCFSHVVSEIPQLSSSIGNSQAINNKTFFNGEFYKDRYDKLIEKDGQTFTEGKLKYKDYTNNLSDLQTTSLLNSPYFINAIQVGVDNYLSNVLNPYVEAGYLFINSLPLATLREKYLSYENSNITDLDYLHACFKKFGALHKVPYAWVLRYGSIWHRYKKWVNNNVDILNSVWKNYDYVNNWNPVNGLGTPTYDLGNGKKITIQSINGSDTQISLGFFPKTISDFNIFYQNDTIFSGFTDLDLQYNLNKKYQLITGSTSADFQAQGFNVSEKVYCNTYTVLGIGDKVKYIMPSFFSNINQTYYELYKNNQLTTSIVSNNSMYNGSVRLFGGIPQYGFFDADKISKPAPTQYLKKIVSKDKRQAAFTLGDSDSYSSIEELFSVFNKEALDQFEEQFLRWCRPSVDSNGNLLTNDAGFGETNKPDAQTTTNNAVFKNFQSFFTSLMMIPESKVPLSDDSTNVIQALQTEQFALMKNQINAFLNYDVAIKYGNPSFMERRVFLSILNSVNQNTNPSTNGIVDPIIFSNYGSSLGLLPTKTSPSNTPLSYYVNLNTSAWKELFNYVGFSSIDGILYSNTGSTVTDFFIDMDIQFSQENVKILAPLIKMYATQKYLDSTMNKTKFLSLLSEYFTGMSKFRDESFTLFISKLQTYLTKFTNLTRIVTKDAPLQGKQTRVELWEMFKATNDKWIAGNNYNNKTLFEDVLFLDRASRNIGDKVFVDIFKLRTLLKDVGMDSRIMTYLYTLIQDNNFVIMSVPSYVNFYNLQDVSGDAVPRVEGSLDFANTMFGTHTTVDIKDSSPKLVCFYADKTSEHTEIENADYRWGSDSFDLRRVSDNPLIENQIGKKDWALSNKVCGFNVDVGIRNQNMFSNIILSQDPGKATSEALKILDMMGNSASGKQTATQNISLFNLYKSRSYTCTVVSMGNAMIQPSMYFNLRHVPMFNGPYMILNVEHTIGPGRFETTFGGVRQSKFSLPEIQDFLQNIYKNYLSKMLEELRRDIQAEPTSTSIYAENSKTIENSSDKKSILGDCTPNNPNLIKGTNQKYILSDNNEDIQVKTLEPSTIVAEIKKATTAPDGTFDKRLQYIIFTIIYASSYKNGGYKAVGNNFVGYDLDKNLSGNRAASGSLENYFTNKYVCVRTSDGRVPLVVFDNLTKMVEFTRDFFKPFSGDILKDKEIETMIRLYVKQWQVQKSDDFVNNFLKDDSQSDGTKRVIDSAYKEFKRLFGEIF